MNYQYTDGRNNRQSDPLEHIAKNKINWGLNYLTLNEKLNINLRFNHVISRQTPLSNHYFNGKAPSFHVANLLLSYQGWHMNRITITPSIEIKNLFDKDYLGVGRQDGSSQISQFDPNSQIDPSGFIPPYHPQSGRVIEAKIRVKF